EFSGGKKLSWFSPIQYFISLNRDEVSRKTTTRSTLAIHSTYQSNAPKDAAAVILLRHHTDPKKPEVFWVKRSTKLAFLGGYHAFPGGKRETIDDDVQVSGSRDQEQAAMISCAAREIFEETGMLLARGSETLTIGQRASLLDD